MAHKDLFKQLKKLDCLQTAKRAKCKFLQDTQSYIITLLNSDFEVNLSDEQILTLNQDSSPTPANFLEQLCILAYLVNARDIPLSEKLVGPQSLKTGQFFFRGLHSLDTPKLEQSFGENPEDLYHISDRLNARQCDFGNASIRLLILPRIPVTIVIWKGDEEFEPRASILFDSTADRQLPLDALGAAAKLTVDALVKAAQ